MPNKKSLLKMLPLFLVLFIDSMGLALLFPILSGIIIDPHTHFLPANVSIQMRKFLYGFTISIFMLCWFFGAAILGDLSDKAGRKKALVICLLGAFIGYLLSAIGIIHESLSLLILGRVIAGFTAGSQPVAQAAIVDVSEAEHKARNIGFILLAVSLGFVFGPIIGGVFSDSHIYHGFGMSTPLYVASGLSLFNAILLWLTFKETFCRKGPLKIRWHEAIYVFISAFQRKAIRNLSIVLLIETLAWSNFFSFISVYMSHIYHFNTFDNSMFLTAMGLGASIGFGILMDILAKRFSLKSLTVVFLFLTGIAILSILLSHNILTLFILVVFYGITLSIAYTGCITLFSNQVGPDEQGWVMGVTGSIMALCFGLSTLFTGWLINFSISIPLILAVIFLMLSSVVLMPLRLK